MRKLLIIVPLVALLVAAIWFAIDQWIEVQVADIPAWGFAAMGFGVLFSLAIGIGLMALVFYSSRHGYDEAAGGERPPEDQP
jgi:hypothetical protein